MPDCARWSNGSFIQQLCHAPNPQSRIPDAAAKDKRWKIDVTTKEVR
ncbi:MAG: hypothetical protein WA708_07430 [Acidobacteriaceae bacterium]